VGFFTMPTEPVDLGGGNTVTVRKLSFGEHQQALSLSTLPGGALDNVRYALEVAKRAVVAWQGDGFEGKEATAANVAALPTEIGAKIANAALELLNVGPDEGE
jgi:hypothetical protein